MEEIPSFWTRWFPSVHVAKRMSWLLGGSILYSIGVAVILESVDHPAFKAGSEWVAVNSLVLGALLVFRNKEAYERWWEARKLWGQLLNDLRNLSMKIEAQVKLNADERRELIRLLTAFPHALKCHLRDDEDLHHVPGFENERDTTAHLPQYIAGRLFQLLARWQRDGRITDATAWMLDTHARALMDICGGCERIHSSPVPFSYRVLLRHVVGLYLLLAPWSLLLETGIWGVPVLAIAFYFLLGIELVAEDVEEPFGTDPDDLPLDRLCEKARQSVEEILGKETSL